jgi:hypothetical protein
LDLILRGGLESLHEGGWTNGGVLSGRKLVSGFLGKAGWRNTELEIGMSKANGIGYRLPESLKLITCISNARSREMGKKKVQKVAQSISQSRLDASRTGVLTKAANFLVILSSPPFILLLFFLLFHHLHCEFNQQYGFTHPPGNEYYYWGSSAGILCQGK